MAQRIELVVTLQTHGYDERDPGQHSGWRLRRSHDALNALVRGQLGDPKLGVHNGLPVTVIVSTTLQELTAGAGQAVTGGGTLLPMRDLIGMASHAYHYLAVFDEHEGSSLGTMSALRQWDWLSEPHCAVWW